LVGRQTLLPLQTLLPVKPLKHRTPAKSLFRPVADRMPPQPAPDSSGEPALDLDALMALPGVNGDRAAPMLKRLLPLFVAETERHIQGLRAGLAAGDAEAVRALAHKMKSGCHAVGALRLAACARRLDERIKAGEPPRTVDVEGIADAWEACRQVLHKEALIGEDAPK
jgi:HPt (histidine-containing phosphotransfer) domain-containing protein